MLVCVFPQICNLGRLSAVGARLVPHLLYWSIFKFFRHLNLFKDFRIYIAYRQFVLGILDLSLEKAWSWE